MSAICGKRLIERKQFVFSRMAAVNWQAAKIIPVLILEYIHATVIYIDGGWGIRFRSKGYQMSDEKTSPPKAKMKQKKKVMRKNTVPLAIGGMHTRSTEFCSVYGGSFVPSYGGGGGALSSLDDQWCLQHAVLEVGGEVHFHELLGRNPYMDVVAIAEVLPRGGSIDGIKTRMRIRAAQSRLQCRVSRFIDGERCKDTHVAQSQYRTLCAAEGPRSRLRAGAETIEVQRRKSGWEKWKWASTGCTP
ncbi:hypothetical protein BU15DRAFT_67678 [Melanogaster broomeanus]|nr:hypothetical protein BU15DRAFT_67678 [Melanogaster broomeanus]